MKPSQHEDRVAWFRAALSHHEGPLVRFAQRRLNGDLEAARDVVQDTFAKLWQADPATVDGHVTQWLYTVCRNRVIDVSKKERRMKLATDEQIEAKQSPPLRLSVEDADAPDQKAQSPENQSEVFQVMETLPERQQEILRLKFQGGLSYKEIAAILDLSVSNVGFLLHNALRTLREQLNPTPQAEANLASRQVTP